ncbi:hypothetical protein VCHENC02_5108, partial [Vibrio harveyi]
MERNNKQQKHAKYCVFPIISTITHEGHTYFSLT